MKASELIELTHRAEHLRRLLANHDNVSKQAEPQIGLDFESDRSFESLGLVTGDAARALLKEQHTRLLAQYAEATAKLKAHDIELDEPEPEED